MDMRTALLSSNKINMFFLQRMPMGFLAGLRVIKFNDDQCQVGVPYNYITKNPFKSIYFAVQAMAAELSTGAIAMDAVLKSKRKISMLVFDMNANFTKKAKTKIIFTCNQVKEINAAVQKCIISGNGETVSVNTIGKDIEGNIVSEFNFTWTFKIKQ